MSPPDVPVDAAVIASVPPTPYRGRAYRQQAGRLAPLSGEGARINGGRFNPPDSFPVLYLCVTRDCAVAELRRLGQRTVIGIEGLLHRVLYEYDVDLGRVLDLTSEAVLLRIGLTQMILTGADWSQCQEVGEAAHSAGFQAIRSPSATGVDEILGVFPGLVGSHGRLEPRLLEEWSSVSDL